MRKARDHQVLFESCLSSEESPEDKGAFIGINLGADFCAEHEWGIKRLDDFLKRDPRTHKIGTKMGEIDKSDGYYYKGVVFVCSKDEEMGLLICDRWYRDSPFFEKLQKSLTVKQFETMLKQYGSRDLYFSESYGSVKGETVATAWDEGSFAILVKGKENIAWMRELKQAFAEGDIAIWFGSRRGLIGNAGLCIAIYSRLPQFVLDEWREFHEDRDRLHKAAEKTGIEKKLKKAGKGFFALSPKWLFKDTPSKHPVIFWLNPYEQGENNAGWFTVEDLEDWIRGEGKIPKTEEQMKQRY